MSVRSEELFTPHLPVHHDRSVLAALVGIIGFFCVWGVAVAVAGEGSTLPAFLNLPSLLLVVVAPFVILSGVYGWAGVVDAWMWVFRRPVPGRTAEDAVTFFQLAACFAMVSGFLATAVGLILTLRRPENFRHLGSGMAVALLSQLYGVFLATAYLAASAYITRRHGGAGGSSPIARRSIGIAGLIAIAGVLTAMITFGILMLSVSPCL